ncbi:6-pyruvoyl tetrahydrobiopterin synthase-like protein [Kickxella alabastrina]|uniref:6-pyruvoyl tetrahydrobiopterin synthase-like protein n=1 Tax=Kickxella alabastrina TaxID=61397 RepID=UPI00221E6B85|nr:6-pyruvoyl tetrahydrobiopterin synthase-like protein [Kickxella alabastrina]KAI7827841.1 6-pyruvoyl tetrahydrobiopterin synthase-like protein [Kickxella alabastrina]
MPPTGSISRTEHFSAAHRLHSPHLSDEENRRVFGKCNHASGHGHNYVLETIVRGPIDAKTGMVVNIEHLKRWIKAAVLDVADHRNLDADIAFFKTRPSTTENLAVFIWIRLTQLMPAGLLHKIVVSETPKNKVVFTGDGLADTDFRDCVV